MSLIDILQKDRDFLIIITNNIKCVLDDIMEQIKLSHCSDKNNASICGKCRFCREFADNRYHYIFRIEKDRTKQKIGIEKMREYEHYFYMKIENGYKKYFFIQEAEDLSVDAQNHMLKTLEEIPDNTFFFFLCRNINNILPTVLSRGRKLFLHSEAEEKLWGDCEELKNVYQCFMDFWASQKKRDINLYETLKSDILLKKNFNYEEKKVLLRFLLDKIGNKIMQDSTSLQIPHLLYVVEEVLEMIMQLKYNVTLELYIMDLYIKILKWKNLRDDSVSTLPNR